MKRVGVGFYAFFGMMPTVLQPVAAAMEAEFRYLEHIIWVKRNTTPGGNAHRLKRGHESIFVFGLNGRTQFNQSKGPFTDVKLPGVLLDVATIEMVDRHIKDLELQVRRGYGSNRAPTSKTSTAYLRYQKKSGRSGIHTELVNYTNVWSFLPPSLAKRNGARLHPTQKPTEVMARLVEMLCPPGGLVIDPFAGSGTTGVACVQTGRRFIGIELDPGYADIARARIAKAAEQARQEALPL